jgi:hypothetical protein
MLILELEILSNIDFSTKNFKRESDILNYINTDVLKMF